MPVLTTAELAARGIRRARIRAALDTGELVRLRIGWYATADTAAEIRAAVRKGGSLSCSAALRHAGVWVLHPNDHVRIDPDQRVHAGTSHHRRPGVADHGVDTPATALVIAVDCLPFEEAVVVLDSALHLGLVSRATAEHLLSSRRGRRALTACDPRSESGLESLVRVRLRRHGIRVRSQVRIGDARVDLLVGDRLVVECDGDLWHSDPARVEADRRRDAELVRRGYVVIRIGYRRIVEEWPEVEGLLLELVHRRDHLWRAAQRRRAR